MSEALKSLEDFLARAPYVRFLGMRAEVAGDEMTAIMPFQEKLVGNPFIPALHGGAIGGFLEMTALAQLALVEPHGLFPKTIGVTVEYLRPGRPVDTYARAELRKIGRRVANVHVEAWQDERGRPIAALRGHFLLGV